MLQPATITRKTKARKLCLTWVGDGYQGWDDQLQW